MANSPLLSIITVVYDGAETLEQTIQSVLNQTYDNIEYIIIDGGSTDGTLDIIRKYEEHIDQWVSEPDKGLYDAMNKGIEKAGGKLIGMINSDDWYEPEAVELIVEAYNKNPGKRIFHGDRYDVKENGDREVRKFNPSTLKFKYYGMTYNHPSMFVHRRLYIHDSYNTSMRSLSDYEFLLNQYLRDSEQFCYIPKAYVNYRLGGISANIEIMKSLREGDKARKKAGFGLIGRTISVFVRIIIYMFSKLIQANKTTNNNGK